GSVAGERNDGPSFDLPDQPVRWGSPGGDARAVVDRAERPPQGRLQTNPGGHAGEKGVRLGKRASRPSTGLGGSRVECPELAQTPFRGVVRAGIRYPHPLRKRTSNR